MKTSQHTAEQIIKILEHAEKGEQTIATVCRKHGIAENTFYRWRRHTCVATMAPVRGTGSPDVSGAIRGSNSVYRPG